MEISMANRYEYIGGGSRKFWCIEKPVEIDGTWAVTVEFGRIGGWAQTRVHPENTKWQADRYYADKVAEKLKKGYVAKYASTTSPKLTGIQDAAKATPVVVKKACQHNDITRKGDTYECKACKTVVENLYQGGVPEPEFQTKVRRFFDLSARATTT
jgi:predicted DNA-binding WGR domain protein